MCAIPWELVAEMYAITLLIGALVAIIWMVFRYA